MQGNEHVLNELADAEWIGISVITSVEYLSCNKLSIKDKDVFKEFEQRIDVIDLSRVNEDLLYEIIQLRTTRELKLPDAIIIASAKITESILLTADKRLKTLKMSNSFSFIN